MDVRHYARIVKQPEISSQTLVEPLQHTHALLCLRCFRTGNSPAVSAVNQGNNNYVVTGKVDSFGDTLSDPRRFDSTGMFHWCAPQQLSTCIIVSQTAFPVVFCSQF